MKLTIIWKAILISDFVVFRAAIDQVACNSNINYSLLEISELLNILVIMIM